MFIADGDNGVMTIASYSLPACSCTLLQNISIGVLHKPHELAYDARTGNVYLAGVGTEPSIQRFVQTA